MPAKKSGIDFTQTQNSRVSKLHGLRGAGVAGHWWNGSTKPMRSWMMDNKPCGEIWVGDGTALCW